MDEPTLAPLPQLGLKARMASGLAVLIPLVITVAVVRFVFNFTSGILLPFLGPALAAWPAWARASISLGILIAVVYVLGVVATNVLGRRVLSLGESVVLRVPFIKAVYSVSKQVMEAIQLRGSDTFESVVFLEFPAPGMQAVGFVTSRHTRDDGVVWCTVFVPTTPNPTTGFLQLIRQDALEQTDFTVEEGIKIVMSLGVLMPTTAQRVTG